MFTTKLTGSKWSGRGNFVFPENFTIPKEGEDPLPTIMFLLGPWNVSGDFGCLLAPKTYQKTKSRRFIRFLIYQQVWIHSFLGVSKNRGTPKWMVYSGKPYPNGWFGGTPIFGNILMDRIGIPLWPQPPFVGGPPFHRKPTEVVVPVVKDIVPNRVNESWKLKKGVGMVGCDEKKVHPWRLTWNIIMEVWKIIFLSKWVICRFHVNLPGCRVADVAVGTMWDWHHFLMSSYNR